MKEAYYYEKKESNVVQCHLCPHECTIQPDGTGLCRVRKNVGGILFSLNYEQITGYGFDPIEKKPLYHFYPGRPIFSFGTFGCNFSCDFCQNWKIAQHTPPTNTATIEMLMEIVKSRDDNLGIAYTYNEPIIFYEFMLDTAKVVHELGYKNVVVTNGFIMAEPLDELLPYVDAFNIDLKAFNDNFYTKICKGKRAPVMETIKRVHGKAHMELTLLLIDGENTDVEELEEMFKWISEIDPDIPLHLSRYYPANRMTNPPTQIQTLMITQAIAEKYLNYVYIGNVLDSDNSTYCPKCGAKVIERIGYESKLNLRGSKCDVCLEELPIINE
jgi:pyruvate formate lyase activating enzyme